MRRENKDINKNINKSRNTYKRKRNIAKMIKRIILIIFLVSILFVLIGAGVFAGIFFSDKFAMSKEDLLISNSNTFVYDSEGNLKRELSGDENRKIVSLGDMPTYLPNAFIAIEDERFYEHHGIDVKRTGAATVTYLFNRGSSSFGGSTITQQLIKNITNDKDDEGQAGIQRKVREMSRAYQIEKIISKSQILELYLNIIYLGGGGKNICGVEVASEYYFSKSAKDLTIAESAFLAGINHSPNNYNPFIEDAELDKINKRTKTVLDKMLELNMISQDEYNTAVEEVDNGLPFNEGKTADATDMSYHMVAAINQVVDQLVEEKGMSYEYAKGRLYGGGYRLYTTEVPSIQSRMQEEYAKDRYIISASKVEGAHSQSAMVIMDYHNGNVVGCMGGLGTDVNAIGLNRINSPRQPGSSIKPIASISPGIETGIITAATVYDDSPTYFGNYKPNNAGGYLGLITVRKAIEVSSNVVEVKIMSELGPENSIKFLKQFGLEHIDEEKDNGLALVLGGITNGVTPLEMAGAYSTIANGGEYITPTFYSKLVDSQGNTVLTPKQEKRRVISEQTAYIVKSILKSPVTGSAGTATNCKIRGMDVGAKTGTTDDNYDRWLCGITPYYVGATWFGFDEPEYIDAYGNPSATIWSAIMDDIHEDLPSKSFDVPSGIVTARICTDSGMSATGSCTHTVVEEFVAGTVPAACNGHKTVEVCKETGKLANEYCPKKQTKTLLQQPEKEKNGNWKTSAGGKYASIKETCDVHKKPEENKDKDKDKDKNKNNNNTNSNTNTTGGGDNTTGNNTNTNTNTDTDIEDVTTIKVPAVVGMTRSQAESVLSMAGLRSKIDQSSDYKEKDAYVRKQSPKAGEEVSENAFVTLTTTKAEEQEE